MSTAPVGIRCPDHAATGRSVSQTVKMARPTFERHISHEGAHRLQRRHLPRHGRTGLGVNQPGGRLFGEFALYGPLVADGDWWRLITAAFLHASLLHIGFNMLALWWVGGPLEQAMGPWRFIAIYGVSGLAGSAGALLASPQAVTVGASGAIFGLFGAMVVIQWQTAGWLAGPAMTLILVNLALTFALPNISWGGHVGGLVGGVLATLALTHFGTRHVAYARITPVAVVSLIAIGVGSVLVAYWRVRGLASSAPVLRVRQRHSDKPARRGGEHRDRRHVVRGRAGQDVASSTPVKGARRTAAVPAARTATAGVVARPGSTSAASIARATPTANAGNTGPPRKPAPSESAYASPFAATSSTSTQATLPR